MVVSYNRYARPLLCSPYRGQLGLLHSMVAVFQEQASQEGKAEAHGIFMVLPQIPHSVASVMLSWLKQSQSSAQVQEEEI